MDIKGALRRAHELTRQRQWDAAQAIFESLLKSQPKSPEVLNEFGNFWQAQRRFEEAVPYYVDALELRPEMVPVLSNLGSALKQLGHYEQSAACYERAIELTPNDAELHNNFSTIFQRQGLYQQAANCCIRALELNLKLAGAFFNLAGAMDGLGHSNEAISLYQNALKLQPDLVDAHFNMGNVLRRDGRLSLAAECYEKTLAVQPDRVDAIQNLGVTRKAQGQLQAAATCFSTVAKLRPNSAEFESNLLFLSQFLDGACGPLGPSVEEQFQLHRGWYEKHGAVVGSAPSFANVDFASERRLRLGFVSADLVNHPVGLFLIRTLEALDAQHFEIACYSDRDRGDEITERFEQRSALWRQTYGWSDSKLLEQICADQVDILFDLAGHTAGSRLRVFAQRPAPLQCTYIGYPGMTGLRAIDFIVTDQWHLPQDYEDRIGTDYERPLRLPAAPFCWEPPQLDVSMGDLPALTSECVTFGSFNNPAKVNEHVIEVWAAILNRVPNSKLLLKYRGLDDPGTQQFLRDSFSRHGVSSHQLEFQGRTPFEDMLAQYQRVDIALDPFPFTGGLTSLLALWMGLPVVTCPGESFASRQTMAYLELMQWRHTVAKTLAEYVDLAVSVASDLQRLAVWRGELRDRLLNSPMCDANRFATEFAAALRTIWRQRCATSSSSNSLRELDSE